MSCQSIAWMSQMLPVLIPMYIVAICCAASIVGWVISDEARKMMRQRALRAGLLNGAEALAIHAR